MSENDGFVICPLCKNRIVKNTALECHQSPFNKEEYSLYNCASCDLEFWYPYITSKEFYEKELFSEYKRFHSGVRLLPYWCRPFFKYFKQKNCKLLDIGCGDGIFLENARQQGFEIYGIDFDSKSVDIAKNKYYLDHVYCMSIEEFLVYAEENKMFFDVISIFEVLEHQVNLEPILRLSKILKEGGHIVGSVPNRDRLFVKNDRSLNIGDYPPHHFLWFSKRALIHIFHKLNVSNVRLFPVNQDLLERSMLLEDAIWGNTVVRIKYFLRKTLLGKFCVTNENFHESIDTIKKRNKKVPRMNLRLIKTLRVMRNIFIVVLTLLIHPLFICKSGGFYFQVQLGKVSNHDE